MDRRGGLEHDYADCIDAAWIMTLYDELLCFAGLLHAQKLWKILWAFPPGFNKGQTVKLEQMFFHCVSLSAYA